MLLHNHITGNQRRLAWQLPLDAPADVCLATAVFLTSAASVLQANCVVVSDRQTAGQVVSHFREHQVGMANCKITAELSKHDRCGTPSRSVTLLVQTLHNGSWHKILGQIGCLCVERVDDFIDQALSEHTIVRCVMAV